MCRDLPSAWGKVEELWEALSLLGRYVRAA
jgi:hypothetical protein